MRGTGAAGPASSIEFKRSNFLQRGFSPGRQGTSKPTKPTHRRVKSNTDPKPPDGAIPTKDQLFVRRGSRGKLRGSLPESPKETLDIELTRKRTVERLTRNDSSDEESKKTFTTKSASF